MSKPSIVESITHVHIKPSRRNFVFSVCVAVCVHGVWWLWAQQNAFSLELWSASLATRVHIVLSEQTLIDTEDKTLPPVMPPKPSKVLPDTPSFAHKASATPSSAPSQAAPSEATEVVTQSENPLAPVDLSGMDFVSGHAQVSSGGLTQNNADTASMPVYTLNTASSRRKDVALKAQQWSCAWPAEAEEGVLNETFVTLKVFVTEEGKATQVRVVSHPGLGFDKAAYECALKHVYTPATDEKGALVPAWSPLIKVRFTRL